MLAVLALRHLGGSGKDTYLPRLMCVGLWLCGLGCLAWCCGAFLGLPWSAVGFEPGTLCSAACCPAE